MGRKDFLPRRRRARSAVLVLAGLPALLLSCGLIPGLGGDRSPRFSHERHVGEKKIDCEDCHGDAKTEAAAGMPALETCLPCHGEKDQAKPPLERAEAFFPGGAPSWTSVARLPAETIFSHKVHAEKEVACDACHRGIAGSDRVEPDLVMGMRGCIDCHSRKGAPTDCSACHSAIRRDRPSPDHRFQWILVHGQASRSGREARERCGLCHSDENCAHCHQEMKPRDHTNFWRIKGHGAVAGIDRDRCAPCHRTDFCDRCHRETPPRSHGGSRGSAQDRHCLSCHSPLSSDGCALCHSGTPSHAMAPPKPADEQHATASESSCRTCHLVVRPPHADNGDPCGRCHR